MSEGMRPQQNGTGSGARAPVGTSTAAREARQGEREPVHEEGEALRKELREERESLVRELRAEREQLARTLDDERTQQLLATRIAVLVLGLLLAFAVGDRMSDMSDRMEALERTSREAAGPQAKQAEQIERWISALDGLSKRLNGLPVSATPSEQAATEEAAKDAPEVERPDPKKGG
jgi:hypothetical protein